MCQIQGRPVVKILLKESSVSGGTDEVRDEGREKHPVMEELRDCGHEFTCPKSL